MDVACKNRGSCCRAADWDPDFLKSNGNGAPIYAELCTQLIHRGTLFIPLSHSLHIRLCEAPLTLTQIPWPLFEGTIKLTIEGRGFII